MIELLNYRIQKETDFYLDQQKLYDPANGRKKLQPKLNQYSVDEYGHIDVQATALYTNTHRQFTIKLDQKERDTSEHCSSTG